MGGRPGSSGAPRSLRLAVAAASVAALAHGTVVCEVGQEYGCYNDPVGCFHVAQTPLGSTASGQGGRSGLCNIPAGPWGAAKNSNSHLNCAEACYAKNPAYNMAGTEYGTECYCGTFDQPQGNLCPTGAEAGADNACGNGDHDPTAPGYPCSKPCPGDASEFCGGYWAFNQFSFSCYEMYSCTAVTIGKSHNPGLKVRPAQATEKAK